jgi:cellulose synthase/poly-beta-1,6-N-acetylglucosamine synthase-like glycosyltransferase
MSKPVASLVVSVYDNVEYLKAVLDSLSFQTEKRFEVIISEDAEHLKMKNFLESYDFPGELIHLTQPDLGWRKNRALNRASETARSEHLIFIDGDCVLHPRFIEFHVRLFEENKILAGKRIKLDPISSEWLMSDEENIVRFQNYLMRSYFKMKNNGAGFMEEGFFISPNSFLGFIPRIRNMSQLKGCNMSFSKKVLYDINGFDEDYIKPAVGEDADLWWRFKGRGYEMKSLRNLAVQYHLFHKESWIDQEDNLKMMEDKQKRELFVCKNGIIK